MPKYAPKLPLELNDNEDFDSIINPFVNIKQNLKMILFTNPGEKIMDPEFGVGIKKYLFEATSGFIEVREDEEEKYFYIENFRDKIFNELKSQCNKYSPDILIENIEINVEENILYFKLFFSYKNYFRDQIYLSEIIP